MPDEEIESVAQEEVAQSTESEQNESARQEEARVVQQSQRRDSEYNWAETRRKLEQQERMLNEQQELIQRLSKPQQEDDTSRLMDDDIITVKQHKTLTAKIARQVAEEVSRQREASTIDERVKNRYSDYDQVVTPENIELLKQNDPEIALSLSKNSDDPYSQMVAAYKYMKNAGYGPKTVPVEKKRAQENSQKPLSVNAVTKQSAIGNAHVFENGLTPELKKQYYAEMQSAIKGR